MGIFNKTGKRNKKTVAHEPTKPMELANPYPMQAENSQDDGAVQAHFITANEHQTFASNRYGMDCEDATLEFVDMDYDEFTKWTRWIEMIVATDATKKPPVKFIFSRLTDKQAKHVCDLLNSVAWLCREIWLRHNSEDKKLPESIKAVYAGDEVALEINRFPFTNRCDKRIVFASTSRKIVSSFPQFGKGENYVHDYGLYVMIVSSWILVSKDVNFVKMENWTYDAEYDPVIAITRFLNVEDRLVKSWADICERCIPGGEFPTLESYIVNARRNMLEVDMAFRMHVLFLRLENIHNELNGRPFLHFCEKIEDVQESTLPFFAYLMARRESFMYNAFMFVTGIAPEKFGIEKIQGLNYALVPPASPMYSWQTNIEARTCKKDGWKDVFLPASALPTDQHGVERLERVVAAVSTVWKSALQDNQADALNKKISAWLKEPNAWRDLGSLARELCVDQMFMLVDQGVPLDDIIA